ncbi:MAG: hypothetical protein JNM63_09520, partial [Spirochaetia bacterium]|nr:hypothetical protein [Spirochaetia bacterium]
PEESTEKLSFEERAWPSPNERNVIFQRAEALRVKIPSWINIFKGGVLALLFGSIVFQGILFFQNRHWSEILDAESLRVQKKASNQTSGLKFGGKDLEETLVEKGFSDYRMKVLRDLLAVLTPEVKVIQIRLNEKEIGLKLAADKKDDLLAYREKLERRGNRTLQGLRFGSMESSGSSQVTLDLRVETPKGAAK